LHDLNAMKCLQELRAQGYRVRNPELTAATPDHGISTLPGRSDDSNPDATPLLKGLRAETAAAGIRLYDVNADGQGIVHVMAPELGLTQPGCLVVCGDSHTCTHGGLGALGFGLGRSEVVHVLATQALYQKKPRQMRAYWRARPTGDGAAFDRDVEIDSTTVAPQVTWGTSPQDVVPVDGRIPDPASASDPDRRKAMAAALDYMGLKPSQPIAGTPI